MSEWKDALIDYVDNNLPEDFELLPSHYQKKILAQLEQDFIEGAEMAEYYYQDR